MPSEHDPDLCVTCKHPHLLHHPSYRWCKRKDCDCPYFMKRLDVENPGVRYDPVRNRLIIEDTDGGKHEKN